jgi:elongation factor Ts
MKITAAMVKELRERTGSGMMECKKALVEAGGELETAIEQMRKSGLAKADKKSGRTAAEGCVCIKVGDDGKQAAMVEVNSETDFVARGDDFMQFAEEVTAQLLESGPDALDDILQMPLPGGRRVDVVRRALIAKLGENINVRRVECMTSADGLITGYLHGGRIGVLVEMIGADGGVGKDIAMHIAASNPVCVDEKEVPQDILDKERAIFSAQAEASGKPANIIEKMIDGRMKKFLGEITLLGQSFIKDPDMKVAGFLKDKGAKVVRFTRFEVGEGIEKSEENFAEEVMAQVHGA